MTCTHFATTGGARNPTKVRTAVGHENPSINLSSLQPGNFKTLTTIDNRQTFDRRQTKWYENPMQYCIYKRLQTSMLIAFLCRRSSTTRRLSTTVSTPSTDERRHGRDGLTDRPYRFPQGLATSGPHPLRPGMRLRRELRELQERHGGC